MTSSGSVVGKINDPRRKVYVEWNIPNYFSLPQKTDTFYDSPPYRFLDEIWNLTIYPNGQRKFQTVGWIGLYLHMQKPVSSHTVTLKLGIKMLDRVIKEERETYTFKDHGYGWLSVYKRTDLLLLMSSYPDKRTLTVFCEADLSSVADAASQTICLESTNYLCRDFQNLLKSEQKSDVTIQVQDRVFRVHKFILEVRSPALASVLKTDKVRGTDTSRRRKKPEMASGIDTSRHPCTKTLWIEKNFDMLLHAEPSRCDQKHYDISITDCDPNAFYEFLQYVYTGKIDNLSQANVANLYAISIKYCMKELKEQCAEYMIENLSVETACDVFVLASKNFDSKLKKSAQKFILKNLKLLVTTDKWISFMTQSPLLAADILRKIIPDHATQSK